MAQAGLELSVCTSKVPGLQGVPPYPIKFVLFEELSWEHIPYIFHSQQTLPYLPSAC